MAEPDDVGVAAAVTFEVPVAPATAEVAALTIAEGIESPQNSFEKSAASVMTGWWLAG